MTLNWRNPKGYTYTDKLPNSGWAWEFLRRNPKFQADWQLYCGASSDTTTFSDIPDELARRAPFLQAIGRWGLATPCDPSVTGKDIPPYLWSRELTYYGVALHEDVTPRAYRDRWCPGTQVEFIGFDLDRPVDPQLKAARAILSQIREARDIVPLRARTKAHRRHWKTYLRALDGEAAGASLTEIGKELFPPTNVDPKADARAELKPAKRLRDGGYRDIVALGD